MALLAWFFFRFLFAAFITGGEADQYIAGWILLAAAPCTAMVLVGNARFDFRLSIRQHHESIPACAPHRCSCHTARVFQCVAHLWFDEGLQGGTFGGRPGRT